MHWPAVRRVKTPGSTTFLAMTLSLSVLVAACSGAEEPAGASGSTESTGPATASSSAPSAEPADASPQRLVETVTASSAAVTPSNLPPDATLPGEKVTGLLADPPGRAVVAVARTADWLDPKQRAERVSYLYGEDGQWRALALTDLGIDLGDGPKAPRPAPGQLSPDGRFYAVATEDRVAIVNLATAELELVDLPEDGTPGLLAWTAWGNVLVGERERPTTTYELSTTGELVTTLEVPIGELGSTSGARFIRWQKADDRLRVTHLSSIGGPIAPPVDTPFAALPLAGRHSGTQVAVWEDTGSAGGGGEDAVVVAEGRTLAAQARLAWPARSSDDAMYGWLRDRSLLLRSDRSVFAWRPESTEAVRLSAVPRGVLASVALDLVALDAP